MSADRGTPLNQIAFSVTDLPGTCRWYQEVFGLLAAGGTEAFKGYLAARVQGVCGARSTCWWLVDAQGYFQLEFFEFEQPATRPQRPDNGLGDYGYRMVGLHVFDFDTVIERAGERGSEPIGPVLGDPGFRRVCLRDPEGTLLEIMEDDPLAESAPALARPDVPAVVRSITVSVPDLEQSHAYFGDALGMQPLQEPVLHQPEHGALWGLADTPRKERLLQAGGVLVELVEYEEEICRPRDVGYRISDQGLLNIALGFRNSQDFKRVHRRCADAGISGNWRPLVLGAWSVVYVNDSQGYSVELLMVRPWYDRRMGFEPAQPPRYRTRRSPRTWQTALVTGAASGIGLRIAETLLSEGTAVGALDSSDFESVRDQLERMAHAHQTRVAFHQADVSDAEALANGIDGLVDELGSPDLAVNSAGIQDARPFADLTREAFERVIEVNLLGSRHFAAAVLPHLPHGSQLAFVASLAGIVPSHCYTAYSASKFGVVGLAGALRLEYLARGIDVSAVCPGEVNTPMVVEERKTLPEVAAQLKDTAGTLEADEACQLIMRQLRKRRALIIPGWRARCVARMAQLFPGIARSVSERIVIAESKRAEP